MKQRSIIILILTLCSVDSLLAQNQGPQIIRRIEKVNYRLGGYAGYGYNIHDTEASIFNAGGECGAFSSGNGKGLILGALGEFPIMGQWLDLTANISLARRDGSFAEAFTGGLPVLDPNTNRYVSLERRHAYTSTIPYVLVEFGLRFEPLVDFPLYLRGTTAVGFSPTPPTYLQTEEIVSPSGVLFPDNNETVHIVSTGEIADGQVWAGVSGAIGYSFPLGFRLTASPEVSFYSALNDVTPHYRWRISSAQAGVAIKYVFGEVIEEIIPGPIAEEPPSLPPTFPQVSLATADPQRVSVVETIVTETFPILPYIFFDSSSSELPSRYEQTTSAARSRFDEQLLPHRSLDAYYHILNILGDRMSRNPSTTIVLKGTTDGREEPIIAAASALARSRAEAIKDYLARVWDIDPTRIQVRTSPTPTFPSNIQYAEGVQENRRVEIISTSDKILEPILHERFLEHSVEPSQVPFTLHATSPEGIANWQLAVRTGSETLWSTGGRGAPPDQAPWSLNQKTAARIAEHFVGTDSLRCQLTVTDNRGQTSTNEHSIPAHKSQHPYEVSRLSLIVFDFDKSDIAPQNRRMVSSFIARSLMPSSTTQITGSTDRLGEMLHNMQLSASRATAVQALIKAERPDANITSTRGIGPSKLIYDNDLPEGRYYCRTVSVEVQTPIGDLTPLGEAR